VALTGLFGFGSFTYFGVSFAKFTAASGGMLIFLAALVAVPEVVAARELAFDTTIGGLIALAAYAVVPRPRSAAAAA
jgi:hypothetical protein